MTVLQSIGTQFRLVGPLTVANGLVNPGFEGGTEGWTAYQQDGLGNPLLVTLNADSSRSYYDDQSCRVDITGSVTLDGVYGLTQTVSVGISPGQDYTLGGWYYTAADAPSGGQLVGILNFYDSSNTLLATHTTLLVQSLVASNSWVQFSLTETNMPDTTQSVQTIVGLSANASLPSTFSYYLDGMIWSAGDSNSYVDGDYAGYVWSGDRFFSTTLQSSAPDALNSFTEVSGVLTPVPVVC